MAKKPIPISSEEVINDAVRLSQPDFVSLYVDLGHAELDAKQAYGKIRFSPRGKSLLKELYGDKSSSVTNLVDDEVSEVSVKVKNKFSCQLKIGSMVAFEDRRSKVKLSGELIKLLIGTDGQEYAKIKRDDGKICLKKVKSIIEKK